MLILPAKSSSLLADLKTATSELHSTRARCGTSPRQGRVLQRHRHVRARHLGFFTLFSFLSGVVLYREPKRKRTIFCVSRYPYFKARHGYFGPTGLIFHKASTSGSRTHKLWFFIPRDSSLDVYMQPLLGT